MRWGCSREIGRGTGRVERLTGVHWQWLIRVHARLTGDSCDGAWGDPGRVWRIDLVGGRGLGEVAEIGYVGING